MGDGPGIYRPLLLSERGRPSRFQENPSAVPPGNMFRKGVRLGGCPKNSDEARIPRSSGNDNDTLYQVKAKMLVLMPVGGYLDAGFYGMIFIN